MRQHDLTTPRRARRRLGTWALLGALSAAALTGCATADDLRGDASTGWLPHAVTESGERITTAVDRRLDRRARASASLVIGLIVWCAAAYRRKKDDNELPVAAALQHPDRDPLHRRPDLHGHRPVRLHRARRGGAARHLDKQPDVTVNVVGKQWSWDFNYVEDDVHEVGTQAILTGEPGAEETIPTMYLPVDERVEFVLTARDVIHSFWVPAFLQKMDMIPGRVNRFQVVADPGGHLPGQVRRAVRRLPLADALQRQGRPARRVRGAHRRAPRRRPDRPAQQLR